MSRCILVSGATGKQGGAVINKLLDFDADFRILALTRNASSASAQRLASQSPRIKLLQGDLDDTQAVFKDALQIETSIWGVFSVQIVQMGKNGSAIEERQGKSLVDEAVNNGVQHFVYTSADRGGVKSSDNPTKVPHFKSKHNIEQHLMQAAAGTNMTWTILRPVAFMDNFDGGFLQKFMVTGWKNMFDHRPLQLVATEDVGHVAAKSFLQPDTFSYKEISLAGDELSFAEMANIYEDVMKTQVSPMYAFILSGLLWFSEDMREMFRFFEKEGFGADVQEMRKICAETHDFKSWLQEKASGMQKNRTLKPAAE